MAKYNILCLQIIKSMYMYNDYILIDLHVKAEFFVFAMIKYIYVFIKFFSNPYMLY